MSGPFVGARRLRAVKRPNSAPSGVPRSRVAARTRRDSRAHEIDADCVALSQTGGVCNCGAQAPGLPGLRGGLVEVVPSSRHSPMNTSRRLSVLIRFVSWPSSWPHRGVDVIVLAMALSGLANETVEGSQTRLRIR